MTEIALIFIKGILWGIFVTWLFELVLKTNKNLREKYYTRNNIIFGYHIHHSTYGLLVFILSIILFILGKIILALSVVGFAIGIIIMHTISDRRFVFIEKQRNY